MSVLGSIRSLFISPRSALVNPSQLAPPSLGADSHVGTHRLAAQASPPVSAAPARLGQGTQIAFHPELVEELKSEHQRLLCTYSEIAEAIAREEWDAVVPGLLKLRSLLTDHLLREGVKLYCYLQGSLGSEEEEYLVFRQFKSEMAGIGKAAFAFFDRYVAKGALNTPAKRKDFREEFRAVGRILTDRMQREEAHLYPLYDSLAPIFL